MTISYPDRIRLRLAPDGAIVCAEDHRGDPKAASKCLTLPALRWHDGDQPLSWCWATSDHLVRSAWSYAIGIAEMQFDRQLFDPFPSVEGVIRLGHFEAVELSETKFDPPSGGVLGGVSTASVIQHGVTGLERVEFTSMRRDGLVYEVDAFIDIGSQPVTQRSLALHALGHARLLLGDDRSTPGRAMFGDHGMVARFGKKEMEAARVIAGWE